MRDKVREGYEEGDYESAYRDGRELYEMEKEMFSGLFEASSGNRVLDLGSGTGLPFDRFLVDQGYDVTGVDIVDKHVEKAREYVPEAEFMQGDFFEHDFGENSFDAIVSFYAIFHIPREEHQELFEQMHHWLEDDGAILVTMGAEEMDEYEDEIEGGEVVWSSYSAEENVELVEEAGYNVLETYIEDWREDDEEHLWILAEPA